MGAERQDNVVKNNNYLCPFFWCPGFSWDRVNFHKMRQGDTVWTDRVNFHKKINQLRLNHSPFGAQLGPGITAGLTRTC